MLIGGVPLSPGHHVVTTGDELTRMVTELRAAPSRAFDFEAAGTRWYQGQHAIGYSIGYLTHSAQVRAFYVPFGHATFERQADPTMARRAFADALKGADEILGHNVGFDLNMGRASGFEIPEWTPLHDTLIQAYLIDENRRFKLETLADQMQISPYPGGAFGAKHVLDAWLARRAKDWKLGVKEYLRRNGHREVPVAIEGEYSCRDVGHTLLLDRAQRRYAQLAGTYWEPRRSALYTNEMLLVRAIADMSWHGQLLDVPYLQTLGAELDIALDQRGHLLRQAFGVTIDWSNDGQVRDLLFNRLNLPIVARTDKDQPSIDRSALMTLAPMHPAVAVLMEWRADHKIRSTYTDSLIEKVGHDGRLHADFVQWGAGTGRLSGREPNLQNIPARDKVRAPKVRRAFLVDPGMVRVFADYSQIELRGLAWITGAPFLLESYKSPAYLAYLRGDIDYEAYRWARRAEPEVDVHGNTARTVFGVDESHPEWKLKRSASKIINFGVPYGGGPDLLSGDPNLRLQREDAERFFQEYHARSPQIEDTRQRLFAKMRAEGCQFMNWAGRIRHGPRLAWRRKRGAGCPVSEEERSMFASLVQGSAAELTRFSLVRIWFDQKTGRLPGRLSLTVHDEIASDAPAEDTRATALGMQRRMEEYPNAFGEIPIVADLETSTTTWAEKKDYNPWE